MLECIFKIEVLKYCKYKWDGSEFILQLLLTTIIKSKNQAYESVSRPKKGLFAHTGIGCHGALCLLSIHWYKEEKRAKTEWNPAANVVGIPRLPIRHLVSYWVYWVNWVSASVFLAACWCGFVAHCWMFSLNQRGTHNSILAQRIRVSRRCSRAQVFLARWAWRNGIVWLRWLG